MALPSTGQLDFAQIYAEINGSHTAEECNMFDMATDAGFPTAGASVSDFFGYSQGSTVIYDYNSTITYLSDLPDDLDAYRSFDFSGRESGQIYRLDLEVELVEYSGAVIAQLYYSVNSTSSWTTLASYATPTTDNISISSIDYNDIIRLRMVLSGKLPDGSLRVTCDGGAVTTGTGTVTASGTVSWIEYVNI